MGEYGVALAGLQSSKQVSKIRIEPQSMEISSSSGTFSREVVIVRSQTKDSLLLLQVDTEELSERPGVTDMDSGVDDSLEHS